MSSSQKPFRGMQINRSHLLAKGLVGAWVMNEGTGDKVFDLSGNGNDGTLTNNADWVSNGLEFPTDAGTDRVNLGSISSSNDLSGVPSGEITIVSKVYKPVDSSLDNDYPRIFDKSDSGNMQNGYGLFYRALTTSSFEYIIGSATTAPQLQIYTSDSYAAAGIYNIAATTKSGDNHIYVNGVEDTAAGESGSFTLQTTTTNAAIGNWNHATGRQWNGYISYVYIYNRALSADEITWLNREPYAMFEEPVSPALLFYDAAAPSGIMPLLLHLYNLMRG